MINCLFDYPIEPGKNSNVLELLRTRLKSEALIIDRYCLDSSEKALALLHLRQALEFATLSIERHGKK